MKGLGLGLGNSPYLVHKGSKLNYYNPALDENISSYLKTRSDYLLTDELLDDSSILPAIFKKSTGQTLYAHDNGTLDIGTSDITLFGWFSGDGTIANYAPLLGKATVSDLVGEYYISLDINKKIRFIFVTTTGAKIILSNTTFVVGTWYFLLAQIDNTNKIAKLFINNVQIGSDLSFTGDFAAVDTKYKTVIGAYNNADGNGFLSTTGLKAFNCGIAKRLLDNAEIVSLYAKKYITNTAAFWPLTYSNNNIYYDVSGGGNHLLGNGIDSTSFSYTYIKNYGSLYTFDYGYSLWLNTENRLIQVPNLLTGENITLAGHILLLSVAGSATSHNLSDSLIEFVDAKFDKSNTDIYIDLIRNSCYYDSTDANTKKRWHTSELNKDYINVRSKTDYSNVVYPRIYENSYNNRKNNLEVLAYTLQNDASQNTKILKYTNDNSIRTNKLRAGISLSFDDTQRSVSWQTYNRQLYNSYQYRCTYAIHNSHGLLVYKEYLKELIKYGHELMNHSVNHNDWVTYLQTHTNAELFDLEITPQQTNIFNAVGLYPKTVGIWQRYERDEDFFDYILANGFNLVRAGVNSIPVDLNDICYNGTSQKPNALDISSGAFTNGVSGDAAILDILEWAKTNDKIVLLVCHSIGESDDTLLTSIRRMSAICKYIYDNNMTFYLQSELIPGLFS